jgi:heme O synthase-like polyprenyltransferase
MAGDRVLRLARRCRYVAAGKFCQSLTMWLTFATFVGYAIVYTVLLKPYTPQNIVIGGMSGAMPPCSGGRQ